jgi:phosphatidyl-myo-inositol dimannoside synthase
LLKVVRGSAFRKDLVKGKAKILYVTPGVFDKGGISRYNRYQIKSLREILGDENVRIISLVGPDNDNFEKAIKVEWHGGANNLHSRVRFVTAILKHVITWRPDIIIVSHVNFSGLVWLYAKLVGAKTVLDIYGQEVWARLSKSAIFGFKNVDYVIADCHATADYTEEKGIRPKGTVEVIWDCVDLNQFRPRPDQHNYIKDKYNLPDRQDHFIILTLGRLMINAAYKGYERLLNVFSHLYHKHPKAILVFAGRGDLVPVLQEKAKTLGVSDRVFFTGSVPEEDMASLYSYAHVFSLVSHCDKDSGEGIPLTPLEAMACRVPIIVGNQDGSREAVISKRNGLVIDPFDLETQRNYIEQLILDKELLEKTAEEALKVSHEFFAYPDFKEKHRLFLNKIGIKV